MGLSLLLYEEYSQGVMRTTIGVIRFFKHKSSLDAVLGYCMSFDRDASLGMHVVERTYSNSRVEFHT